MKTPTNPDPRQKPMHPTEKCLIALLRMIGAAGINTTTSLRAQPLLFGEFQRTLHRWLTEVAFRSRKNADILRQLRSTSEDAASAFIAKTLGVGRRITVQDGRTYTQCLDESLHPQLDLTLRCNASMGPRAAVRYLVTSVNNFCCGLIKKKTMAPAVTPADVEQLRHCDDAAPDGSVHRHASPPIDDSLQQRYSICAALSLFNGEDVLRDVSILSRRLYRLSRPALVSILLSGNVLSLVENIVAHLSSIVGMDCSDAGTLGPLLEAARSYKLPACYRSDPEALLDRLYKATSGKAMQKLMQRMMEIIA